MSEERAVVRVGIVGLGRSGWNIHAAALATLPEQYRVVAVSDPLVERQAEARARFGCRAYTDFADLIADDEVELATIASPSHLHVEQAIAAMRAGKNVLVEKPFAPSGEDADRLIAVARETGRLLTCNQNCRYYPDFLKVREVLGSGVLGEIIQIRIAWHQFTRRWDWQTLREYRGGTLNNNMSHIVDQELLLLGEVELDVPCWMVRTPLSSGEAEDHVKVVLSAPGKPTIDLEVTAAAAYPQDRWLVMGSQGGLVGTAYQLRWKSFDPALLPARAVDTAPTPDRRYNDETFPWVEESAEIPRDGSRKANAQVYRSLYPALREGAPLPITAESVRRQIAVLDACRAQVRAEIIG